MIYLNAPYRLGWVPGWRWVIVPYDNTEIRVFQKQKQKHKKPEKYVLPSSLFSFLEQYLPQALSALPQFCRDGVLALCAGSKLSDSSECGDRIATEHAGEIRAIPTSVPPYRLAGLLMQRSRHGRAPFMHVHGWIGCTGHGRIIKFHPRCGDGDCVSDWLL